MRLSKITCMAAVGFICLFTHAIGQEQNPLKPSALGVRQQRIERMMDQLEKKFETLSEALFENEPERAERLKQALQESKKMLIAKRMTSLTELLNQSRLDTATQEQQLVIDDLRELLRLLLDDENQAADEFDRLQDLKNRLEDALRDQRGHKRESEKIARPEDTLRDLNAQIAALETLIVEQEKLIEQTADSNLAENKKLADQQGELRDDTEKLAREIAAAGKSDPNETKPGETKPGEGKPGEGKPGEGKPGEGKPGEGKPGEGKPGEGKPGEGKPGEGKPGEGKPGDSAPPEAGQKPLEEAVARQKSAEVKLAEGKKADAKNDQKKALAKMKEALEDLKKEQRRIASLPPEEFERLARNQKRTAAQTAKIAEEMKKSDESDPSGNKKTPGQSQVKKAQQAMEQASSDLQGEDPEGAEKQQDEAIKELEKALQEIEERLAQLREETQAEKLAKLEARFKEMLILQEEATLQTALLHKKSESEGSLSRTDRIAVAKLASQERALAEMAFQAYEILIEDGTSVVFPHMVDGIRADLELTAEMLEAKRTDRNTQAIQQEVEESLRELIEALQKAKGEKKEGGGGSGGGGKQPLLPNSAELKLLRAEQLRINRRTKRFDRSRPDDGQLDDYLRKEISNLALRQQDIAFLTEQIVERMRRQAAGL